MNDKKGRFIVFEGIDGSGKSTQLLEVDHWLRRRGIETCKTREPGGTKFAEALRALIMTSESVSAKAELLGMLAARADHLERVVLPKLKAGTWVLCDRFADSSYAYQGGGRGVDMDEIEALEHLVQGDLHPDLVVLLDIPVEMSVARISKRKGSWVVDKYERENEGFFTKVRDTYIERALKKPHQYFMLSGDDDLPEVTRKITNAMERRFSLPDQREQGETT